MRVVWVTAVVSLAAGTAHAAEPGLQISLGEGGLGPAVRMIITLTLLAISPFLVLSASSFVRIVVVFSFLRTALGTQSAPPQQVMVGLALMITMAVMAPVGRAAYEAGLGDVLDGRGSVVEGLERGSAPLRDFLLAQTREADLALFCEVTRTPEPKTVQDVSFVALLPAFVISELRTAFEMGFTLFLPFLVIDLVVATLLMALGMVMLPPAMVSLPIKIMLFVLVDGWHLMVTSLVRSFA